MTVQDILLGIERRWRAGWMHALTAALPGERTTSLPSFDRRDPVRVLFLRYERIGDLIMATGMIRVLATAHPNIQLDVVATPGTATVLEHNPYVHRVFTLDRQSWQSYLHVARALRSRHYDIIVDGRINNPKLFASTPLLMLAAGAPYRVGVSGGFNDRVYNVRVPAWDRTIHYIEGAKELARPFGVPADIVSWQPEIFLTLSETDWAESVWQRAQTRMGAPDTRRLLVNLSASEPKRRWEDDKFIEVLQSVRAAAPHLPMVVIGLPSEWSSVERVALAANALPTATPALRQALALVATSDRVFTPDTSISHAASAFQKPAVVLLKRDHAPYAPWNIPAEIIPWDGETIHALPVSDVRPAVLRLLER